MISQSNISLSSSIPVFNATHKAAEQIKVNIYCAEDILNQPQEGSKEQNYSPAEIQTYLELVQLQLVGIFTNTENVLQVDRCLNVLHTQLLQAGKLKTKCQFVNIHDQKNILDMTYREKRGKEHE